MVMAPKVRSALRWMFTVLWGLGVLVLLLTYWQTPFFLNLVSSFRYQITLAILALGIPTAALWKDRRASLFLALSVALTFPFWKYYWPLSSPAESTTLKASRSAVSLVVANVLSSNHDLERFEDWLAIESPDIVGILEVSEAHQAQLEKLPYPHKLIHPQNGNFGLALLCREAPLEMEVLEAQTSFPSIFARWPNYSVLLTHPIPPVSQQAREVGDRQVGRLIASLADTKGPLIVIGDLNAAQWDLRLEPLREAGLVDARLGHGLLPSWPVDRTILRIPIDHIFLPSGWASLECGRGPDIGSDHFPLICKAQPKP